MIELEAEELVFLPLIFCGVFAMTDWLDQFWEDLLSEEPLRIIAAWSTLDDEEKSSIHRHLISMSTEDGWADVQRQSAQAALHAIDSDQNK
jgi:hypothetical protein